MLSRGTQIGLVKRYSGPGYMEKRAFTEALGNSMAATGLLEGEYNSAILFVDIASFSTLTRGWSATKIREYLDRYYGATLGIIDANGGVIDRIIGDGILAVFSPVLVKDATLDSTLQDTLSAAESLVSALYGTDQAVKVAIAEGKLLYCKTGLGPIYEQVTVIGEPITTAYRLEEQGAKNEVVMVEETILGKKVWAQGIRGSALGATNPKWDVKRLTLKLKGVGGETPTPCVAELLLRK